MHLFSSSSFDILQILRREMEDHMKDNVALHLEQLHATVEVRLAFHYRHYYYIIVMTYHVHNVTGPEDPDRAAGERASDGRPGATQAPPLHVALRPEGGTTSISITSQIACVLTTTSLPNRRGRW
jgi:hypothetical protein